MSWHFAASGYDESFEQPGVPRSHDAGSLQEEIGPLEVPVHREQPRSAPQAGFDVEAQQQQQQ